MDDVTAIGLLDGGVAGELRAFAKAAARFEIDSRMSVCERPADDGNGHGSALAAILAAMAPGAALLDAQVFDTRGASSPMLVAAGLRWLVDNGARVVNMSFGLMEDRDTLRLACDYALKAGAILIAATPVRGRRVFPAAYPGLIRVSADGRCGHRELSRLGAAPADFGACPLPVRNDCYVLTPGGSSYATAHATAMVASWMIDLGRPATRDEAFSYMRSLARQFDERFHPANGEV